MNALAITFPSIIILPRYFAGPLAKAVCIATIATVPPRLMMKTPPSVIAGPLPSTMTRSPTSMPTMPPQRLAVMPKRFITELPARPMVTIPSANALWWRPASP
jgi:hypothetical protein